MSYIATSKGFFAVTNGHMLPAPDDTIAKNSFEKLFPEFAYQSLPEHRTLWVIVTSGMAQSLEECTSPWDLVECVLHAVLGKSSHHRVPVFNI